MFTIHTVKAGWSSNFALFITFSVGSCSSLQDLVKHSCSSFSHITAGSLQIYHIMLLFISEHGCVLLSYCDPRKTDEG